MNVFKTLPEARQYGKEKGATHILGIDHITHGACFVATKAGIKAMTIVLKNTPNSEIKAFTSEHNIKTDEELAEEEAILKNTVEIYLSSRGWGDYSPVKCNCDLRKSDSELLKQCRDALNSETDVDSQNQSDEEILSKISSARSKHATPVKKPEPVKYGPGYCYSCESYCFGDCGDYHPQLTNDLIARRFHKDISEQNFGIND